MRGECVKKELFPKEMDDGLMFPVTELWFLPDPALFNQDPPRTTSNEKNRRISRRSSSMSIDDAFASGPQRYSSTDNFASNSPNSNDSVFDDTSPFFSEAERKRLLQYFGIYLAERCSSGYDVPRASPRRTIILISTCKGKKPKTVCRLNKDDDFLTMMGKWLSSSPDAEINSFILCSQDVNACNERDSKNGVKLKSRGHGYVNGVDLVRGSFNPNSSCECDHYDEMHERPLWQLHALLLEEEKKKGLFFSPAVTAMRMLNPNLQMTFARESIRKMGQLSSTFIFDFIRKLSSVGCILPSEENLLNLVDSGWYKQTSSVDKNQVKGNHEKRKHDEGNRDIQSKCDFQSNREKGNREKGNREKGNHEKRKHDEGNREKMQTSKSVPKSIYVRNDILESKIFELLRQRKVLLNRGRATIDPDLFHIGFSKWILSIVLKRMGKKMYEHLQFLKQNEPYVRDPADKQLLKLNAQLNKAVVVNKGFGSITMESAPDCIKALHNVHMKDMIRFNLATIFSNMFKVKDNHMAYTQFIESISTRSSINYGRRSVIRQRIDSELAKVAQIKKDMPCSTRQRIFGDNSKLGIVCPYSSPEGCLAKRTGTLPEIKEVLDPHSMTISDVWLHTNPI